jgi:FixJ family two-component response regulator
MTPLAQRPQTERTTAPRILVVDDEFDVVDFVSDALGRNIECQLSTAANCAEAGKIIESQGVDLLIVDVKLPDGDGAALVAELRKKHPLASAIVVTGAPSVESAVSALRHGAVDFLAKPFTMDEFLRCVRNALQRNAASIKSEGRIDRLRVAVKRLNDARKLVTRKVDLLCNDLVAAYGDLSKQLDLVRTTESFRGAINTSDDLEQMLCHAMDWILRQMGYANVAIWLAGPDPDFQLGAYMKYTIAGEPAFTEAMRNGILQVLRRDGMMHLGSAEAAKILSPAESQLRNQALLGIHCTYLGESLAGIVLFRDGSKPFSPEDAATLRAIAPVFAITLATLVRSEVDDELDQDAENPDGSLLDESDEDSQPRRKKRDEADWWKRGEPPPF